MSAINLNQVQVNRLKDAYVFFDKDNTGITPEQVQKVLGSMGRKLTAEDANAAVHHVDSKGDGKTVQFQDFVTCMAGRVLREEAGIPHDKDADLRDAFQAFAPTGSNAITAMNIRNVLATLGQVTTDEEIREMMKILGTKSIDFAKFCQLYEDI